MDDFEEFDDALTDEQEALVSGPLLTETRISLNSKVASVLVASAVGSNKSVSEIAQQVLEEWADRWTVGCERYMELIAGKGEIVPKKTEHFYKKQLAVELRSLGIDVSEEVDTGKGAADLVVRNDGAAVCVIEVKLRLDTWRDAHGASGQASAYAQALKCKSWFVVAPFGTPRLFTGKVLRLDEAAARIQKAVQTTPHDPHRPPHPDRSSVSAPSAPSPRGVGQRREVVS